MGDISSRVIRHAGAYAFVHGRWLASQTVPGTVKSTTVSLWGDVSSGPFPSAGSIVSVSEVKRMVDVSPWCVYRGLRFDLTRVYDAEGRLVWRDVRADEPGMEALLIYELHWPEWRRVSKWKNFVYHDPRELGLVEGRVPLSKIEDYGEIVTEIPIPGREASA